MTTLRDDPNKMNVSHLSVAVVHHYRAAVLLEVMWYSRAEHVLVADLERLHEGVLHVSLKCQHLLQTAGEGLQPGVTGSRWGQVLVVVIITLLCIVVCGTYFSIRIFVKAW